MSKHFLPKDISQLTTQCLKGMLCENDSLSLLENEKVVFNNKYDPKKVSLISGGGSGHEPGWSGFVGAGMLTAAAQGDVFASPNDRNIQAAEKVTHSEAGTLFIITNYTGDNLYFGMAVQDLISRYGNNNIKLLRCTDDVAVGRSIGALVGRRTLTGCVLITKVLGAASERGYTLEQIYKLGEQVNSAIASINAGLNHVHIPGHSPSEFYGKLGDNEIEIGLGIHNEPGVIKEEGIPTNEDLIARLLRYIFDKSDQERGYFDFDKGDDIEKALVFTVVDTLEKYYGISPIRVYSGPFVTSLNAQIFTITLMNVTKSSSEEFSREIIFELLDDTTDATGWSRSIYTKPASPTYKQRVITNFQGYADENINQIEYDIKIDPALLRATVTLAAENVIAKEPDITLWDTQMGDGDCGKTLQAGCNAVLRAISDGVADRGSVLTVLKTVLKIIKVDMGGTLGAILFIFMNAFITKLEYLLENNTLNTTEKLAESLTHAITTLCEFTKARIGHRTVMDVLIPFCEFFDRTRDISVAIQVAEDSAKRTSKLTPKLGRATYVGIEDNRKDFPPDPGAYGVYEVIAALRLLKDI
ncbi:dihydroxyacetone kinase isoenzyme I [Scheffersomyces xylosifermentans]|uniref:dihydroxyacetone kinase isoenzyme I n=1 Tax=Scheffersomyces xylosifermentans TaxID=1304137 RepID=UPI00315DC988